MRWTPVIAALLVACVSHAEPPTLPPDVAEQATALRDEARAHAREGRWQLAAERIDEAADVAAQHLGEDWWAVRTRRAYADHYRAVAGLDEQSRDLLKQGEQIQTSFMEAYRARDYAEAARLAERQLELRERALGPDDYRVAQTLNNLALMYYEQGRFDRAEPMYRRAIRAFEPLFGVDHPYVAQCYQNLALVRLMRGDRDGAAPLLEEALRVRTATLGENDPAVAQTLNTLSELETRRGDYGRAVELETRARDILTAQDPDNPEIPKYTTNIGEWLMALGRFDEAELELRGALERRIELLGEDHTETAWSRESLGDLCMYMGRFDESIELHREALRVRTEQLGAEHGDTARSEERLGRALAWSGDLEGAREMYERALEHALVARTRIADDERARAWWERRLDLAPISEALARMLLDEGRGEEALAALERGRGRAVLDLLGRPGVEVVEALRHTGEEEQADRLELALAEERAARERVAELERSVASGEDLDSELGLARRALRTAEGDVASALLSASGGAEPRAVEQIRATLRDDELLLVYIWEEPGHPDPVREASERALVGTGRSAQSVRVMLVARDGPIKSHEIATGHEVAELRELCGSVREWMTTAPGEASGDIGEALRRVEREALAESERLFSLLTPDAVRDRILGARRIVIVPDGPVGEIPLGSLAAEAGTDTASTRFVADEGVEIVYASSASIYTDRVTLPRTEASGGITVVGDPVFGGVAGVTIASVRSGSAGERAGLRAGDVIVSVAGRSVLGAAELRAAMESGDGAEIEMVYERDGERRTTSVARGRLGIRLERASRGGERAQQRGEGDEISALDQVRLYGGRLAPLPGTRVEAQRIANTAGTSGVDTTLLLGPDATVGALERSAPGSRLLHLATHGLLGTRDAFEASIALTAPDEATVDDIGFLTLGRLVRSWRGWLEGCELVVLSACDTQRGGVEGDTRFALPVGFMYAGARAVVASQWRVDDESTADLMELFYERLLAGDGSEKLTAFSEAKREMRQSRPHPYHWGAFVYMGDPR